MTIDLSSKIYDLNRVVSFYKTDELYGGLSNMSGINYPLQINGINIRSTEALYQACRFPANPEIQRLIIDDPSPMGAKMRSKPHRIDSTRPDFEEVKVDIMYWCLRVKLFCNRYNFGNLLELTKEKDIVEVSRKDPFWGCKRLISDDSKVEGQNVLGKLLVKIREENKFFKINEYRDFNVEPLGIPNFKLMGKAIETLKSTR